MREPECRLTELPVSMCAHCTGADKRSEEKPNASGATIEARYPGACRCGCREPWTVGDSITYSSDADGWCKTEHVEPLP